MDHTPRSIGVLSLVWISAIAAPVIGGPAAALAATILVNDLTASGPGCTLRKAIASAEANADVPPCTHQGDYGDDIIELTPGTYNLSTADNAPNGYPVVTSNITIVGKGSTIARTNGDSLPHFRLFRVTGGHLKLLELTLSGGLISNATGEGDGGAIRATGPASLTLASVTLSSNRVIRTDSSTARGGALSFARGALTVMDTLVMNNSASSSNVEFGGGLARGGGIYIETDSGTPVFPSFVDVFFQGNRAAADGGAGGDARGGGLFFEGLGVLSVTRATFRINSATANGTFGRGGVGWGGGIFFQGDEGSAELQLASVVVEENLASATSIGNAGGSAAGAGVYVIAANNVLGIRDSTFSQNLVTASASSGTDGGTGRGGAIYVNASGSGAVAIRRSGVAQNTVLANGVGGNGGAGQGGGIFFQSPANNLTLSDVTVAGNSATANTAAGSGGAAQGGGVYFSSNATLALVNTTVTTNSVAAAGTSGGAAQGGGVFLASSGTVQNSIFSENVAAAGVNCFGSSITSLGNNLFADGGACGANGTDKVGVPAGLGALTDNGEPGGVFRPLVAGSEAIDGGNPAACPVIDQLGRGHVGTCDIGAVEFVPNGPPTTTLVAAVLPASRAGVTGSIVTAFVTIINAGTVPAYQVGIAISGIGPGSGHALLTFQTTDPNTNLPIGTANTPVDIGPGSAQTYVIALLLTGPFDPANLGLIFAGTNTEPVSAIVGLNTFLASAATTSIPDVVALAATIGNTGIVDVAAPSNAGVFSVAVVNLGAADTITAVSTTGGATLPLAIFICETDAGSNCTSPPAPTVPVAIATNATPTFAVFVTGLGAVPFDPANNRIFIFFVDSGGHIRGGTSVAVRTIP